MIQVVIMGVTGVGKTTVGQLLAQQLQARFVDADVFHPAENVEKMRAGIPLTDIDRQPWLDALNSHLRAAAAARESVVLACSALKSAYRERLRDGLPELRFVHLAGSRDLIAQRLAARSGHYMNPALLDSQFATLEPPDDALRIDIGASPEELARTLFVVLGRSQAVPPGTGSA